MKKIALFISLSLIFFSCSRKQSPQEYNFTVNGEISNAPLNTYVKLYYRGTDNIELADSTVIDDSKFTLHGKSNGIDFFVLEFASNPQYIYVLADSGDVISLTLDYKNLRNYIVENSEQSKLIQVLENHLNKTDSILKIYIKNNKNIDSILLVQKEFSLNFIKKYDTSLASIIALSEKFITDEPVLPIEDNYDLFKQVQQKLLKKYGSTEYYRQFAEFIKNYEIQLARNKPLEQNIKPDKLVDFSTKTIDEQEFSLKSLQGNYILLNFWASWCMDCVENNKILKNLDNNSNIKIVQISLDNDEKILSDTLKKYNFSHILINENKIWQSEIVKKYAVDKLPTNIVIAPNGKIVLYTTNTEKLKDFLMSINNE